MKTRILFLLIAALSVFQVVFGQKPDDPFGKREEVYFSFPLGVKAELTSISRQISVDRFSNDTVWAYANRLQFDKFTRSGYEITILPHPGDGPGIVMRDQVQLIKGTRTTWNFYPTYPTYEALMADFQAMYPSLCHLETITTLPSGHKILVVKISDNVSTDEAEPEFLYTSSMHGDETTGYILMLHLIEYLLQNYGTDPEVTDLVNGMEIYINPLANPDGTYRGGDNSVSGATRYNINNVDLNRNYPDPEDGDHPDGNAWQPETIAFMNFAAQHDFVAGANFHGGIEVVNYPWDTWSRLSADNNWWVMVSREYADVCQANSPSGYMDDLDNGITNGYAWYEVAGGRQDYMNYFHHCREFTLEISTTKMVPAAQLPNYWNYNFRSFLLFLKQATYGFHGLITDQVTGNPVEARVLLIDHDSDNSEVYSTAFNGDYSRPVKAGTYTLEFSAPCYITQTFPNRTIQDYSAFSLSVQLVPGAGVTTAAVSSITSTGAVSGGNVICEGTSTVTARGVCWGTSLNPVVTGPHTTDGSGPGVFVSNITGLSASTTYYVRAYAVNMEGTFYGDNVQFTTVCEMVSAFPWTEGFENGGMIPLCWTQEQVNNSGINWIFISGNGTGYPASARSGAFNACLKDNTAADDKTLLITPPLNLSGILSPTIQFWHTQTYWSPDQDELSVYYKTSSSGPWVLLTTYTGNISVWTSESLSLPDASDSYYIGFEGNAKYGRGVCLDDVSVTGTPRTLTVTPPDRNVGYPAGSVNFDVVSNSEWTAGCSQAWCSITPSGNGNATITAVYEENTTGLPRIATIEVTVPGINPVTVTLTQEASVEKVLNLTLFLEGLFNGTAMNKSRNGAGDQFPGNTADEIIVELHEASAPYALADGPHIVGVNTDGTARVIIPVAMGESYFIVIRHRNSIETWSSSPVSFSGATISYNFTDAATSAFGGNLKLVSGKFVIYGGDVNQDGQVDSADMTPVDNDSSNFITGYLSSDCNGDGIVDTADMTLLDNNSSLFIALIVP